VAPFGRKDAKINQVENTYLSSWSERLRLDTSSADDVSPLASSSRWHDVELISDFKAVTRHADLKLVPTCNSLPSCGSPGER